MPLFRNVAEEHDRRGCPSGLPPPRVRGQFDEQSVPVIQLGDGARGALGAGAVLLVRLRLCIPLPGTDQRIAEARGCLINRRFVAACPAHEIPTSLQREQHAGRRGGTRPLKRQVPAQFQPQPHAGSDDLEGVSGDAVTPPPPVTLLGRVPRGDELKRRDCLEEVRDRRLRPEPTDHVPAGLEHRRDRLRPGRLP